MARAHGRLRVGEGCGSRCLACLRVPQEADAQSTPWLLTFSAEVRLALLHGLCDLRRRRLSVQNGCSGGQTTVVQRQSAAQPQQLAAKLVTNCHKPANGRPKPAAAIVQPGSNQGPTGPTGVQPGLTGAQPDPNGPNLGPNLTQTYPNSDAIRSNLPKHHCQSDPQVVYDRAFVQL